MHIDEKQKVKATLHFICGKMAAGKTTLSMELEKEHNAILICEDKWLQKLYPREITNFEDYLKYARRLREIIIPHVKSILSKGISVVLDFPANVPVQREWMKQIYIETDADHVLHYLDVSNEKCIEQLKKRNIEKPEGSMEMSIEQFEQITALFVEPREEEGFNIKIHKRS